MKITLSQKELIEMIQEKINSELKVDEVSVIVKTEKCFKDNISFEKNDFYIGAFIKEEIKGDE